jgi:hypothetical protein
VSSVDNSGLSQPVNPALQPTAPTAPGQTDGAAEVYRRAVQAKPTGFTENPIAAMASGLDRLGGAAARLLGSKHAEGKDGLGPAEERFKAASEAARANPNSLAAKQNQLRTGLQLFQDMQGLAPNDPRRVKVATFLVRLANQVGPDGLRAMGGHGMDVRGLLRLAAHVSSRFGDGAAMQEAFHLEGSLRSTLTQSPQEAQAEREQMMEHMGLSKSARAALANNWSVRMAKPGELPSLDVQDRQMVLAANQRNASLGVLARAWWQENSINNPADRDGFIAAFLKVANQGGFVPLNRKYRELRRMARHQQSTSRTIGSLGGGADAPVFAAANQRGDDESGDMFAALAVFARGGDEHAAVPDSLQPVLHRFFAR